MTPRERAASALMGIGASEMGEALGLVAAIERTGLKVCGTCAECGHWRPYDKRNGLCVMWEPEDMDAQPVSRTDDACSRWEAKR